jgi:hypothetical protein
MKKNIYPLLLMLPCLSGFTGEVTIVDASASPTGSGVYRFDVTLSHADSGWDHYADGWEVVAPNGRILGQRTLYHPHVEEQPFTRSLSGVVVPETIDRVEIRAHDKVHGHGTQLFRIELQ